MAFLGESSIFLCPHHSCVHVPNVDIWKNHGAAEAKETRKVQNKRVAHLEGSGQEGNTPRAPSRGSWGGVLDDAGSRRHPVRVTDSHPGCLRQSCRLRPEPHQSPIRIKASKRARTGPHSSPWHHGAPDNCRCPTRSTQHGTGCWAAGWRHPFSGSWSRRLSPRAGGEGN